MKEKISGENYFYTIEIEIDKDYPDKEDILDWVETLLYKVIEQYLNTFKDIKVVIN